VQVPVSCVNFFLSTVSYNLSIENKNLSCKFYLFLIGKWGYHNFSLMANTSLVAFLYWSNKNSVVAYSVNRLYLSKFRIIWSSPRSSSESSFSHWFCRTKSNERGYITKSLRILQIRFNSASLKSHSARQKSLCSIVLGNDLVNQEKIKLLLVKLETNVNWTIDTFAIFVRGSVPIKTISRVKELLVENR
jgi:hypothetical protein